MNLECESAWFELPRRSRFVTETNGTRTTETQKMFLLRKMLLKILLRIVTNVGAVFCGGGRVAIRREVRDV